MKILLPVDGSQLSLEAVRFAIRLVREGLQASFVLANVQEPATLYEVMVAHDADVLQLAARLELGATNAYLGVIPAFGDSALSKVAARLAADETMHWTALSGALGQSLPTAALGFGA